MPFDEEELDPHGECRHEIERLRAALKPFADAATTLSKIWDIDPKRYPDDERIARCFESAPFGTTSAAVDFITFGHLRAARAALTN